MQVGTAGSNIGSNLSSYNVRSRAHTFKTLLSMRRLSIHFVPFVVHMRSLPPHSASRLSKYSIFLFTIALCEHASIFFTNSLRIVAITQSTAPHRHKFQLTIATSAEHPPPGPCSSLTSTNRHLTQHCNQAMAELHFVAVVLFAPIGLSNHSNTSSGRRQMSQVLARLARTHPRTRVT